MYFKPKRLVYYLRLKAFAAVQRDENKSLFGYDFKFLVSEKNVILIIFITNF